MYSIEIKVYFWQVCYRLLSTWLQRQYLAQAIAILQAQPLYWIGLHEVDAQYVWDIGTASSVRVRFVEMYDLTICCSCHYRTANGTSTADIRMIITAHDNASRTWCRTVDLSWNGSILCAISFSTQLTIRFVKLMHAIQTTIVRELSNMIKSMIANIQ